jgi:hypothetical protein
MHNMTYIHELYNKFWKKKNEKIEERGYIWGGQLVAKMTFSFCKSLLHIILYKICSSPFICNILYEITDSSTCMSLQCYFSSRINKHEFGCSYDVEWTIMKLQNLKG